MKFLVPFMFVVTLNSVASSYYVDFVGGSDSANGTSTINPFKHCPGDANYSGGTNLQSGDTVTFKGGSVYRGNITVQTGVNYIGTSAWGSGKAILDGSTVIGTQWTQCTNAADAIGNPNWSNIWWTTIPAGISNCLPTMISNGTNLCQWSQEPDPSDKIFWEVLSEWRAVHQTNISITWIHDSANLTQTNGYYDQCYAAIWVTGNATVVVPITNYFQSSNTVWVANPTAPYNDRTNYYSVINHPQFIDVSGEWAVRTNHNRIYLWPIGSSNPNNQEISIARRGNALSGFVHDVTVNGFEARGYYQQPDDIGYSGQFCAIGNSDWITHNVTVTSNEIYLNKSFNSGPTIDVQRGSNALVSWNYIHDNLISRGMLLNGTRWSRVSNNTLHRNNGTGIYFNTSTNGSVNNNRVLDNIGIHGNGISVYYSTNVSVYANVVSNCTSMLTTEGSADITYYNNLFDAAGNDYRVNEWGGMFGPVRWFNNTFVGNTTGNALNFAGSATSYIVQNNIIDGGGSTNNHTHNIYTALAWWQDAFYGWSLGTGESVRAASSVFVNPSAHDWRLKFGSPAIGSGTNLNNYFTTDIVGGIRTTWDIGAYAYDGDLFYSPTNLQVRGPVRIEGSTVFGSL